MKGHLKCDACGAEGELRLNRYNLLPPLRWYASRAKADSDVQFFACGAACVDKLEELAKQWYAVDKEFKMVPVGREDCRWCKKFDPAPCPTHRKKAA